MEVKPTYGSTAAGWRLGAELQRPVVKRGPPQHLYFCKQENPHLHCHQSHRVSEEYNCFGPKCIFPVKLIDCYICMGIVNTSTILPLSKRISPNAAGQSCLVHTCRTPLSNQNFCLFLGLIQQL